MAQQHAAQRTHQLSFFARIKYAVLRIFQLTSRPVVRVYHGYGTAAQIVVFGHVLSLSPLPLTRYRRNYWANTFAMLRNFMIKPLRGATVELCWNGTTYQTETAADGFFRFECTTTTPVATGLHEVKVTYRKTKKGQIRARAEGEGWIVVADESKRGFISDIDDTFLISHSASLWRKLYVLFTKNAHSRQPFDGVVKHYRLLAQVNARDNSGNPFFYVSSSEWNLYGFIKEFCRKNQLPEGVFLLSQMKTLRQVWKTGGNKHATKFMRISRIMEAFPLHRFVLFGDDSQMDPQIYAAIAGYFPNRIEAVYLRHVHHGNLPQVQQQIDSISSMGIPVCHFEHSQTAIEHSIAIGLIQPTDAA